MTIFSNRICFAVGQLTWMMLLVAVFCGSTSAAISLDKYPKLQAVADQLIAENYYSQSELDSIFSQINLQPSVLEAMQNPAEYKFTWGKYRKLFLQDDRIQQGVDFWQQYIADLERAEKEYGVPASVIVAIIGVESKFGKYKGKHKVLDSLSTLVVGFERRSKFFAGELKEFLILAKENKLAATDILGSYAGAVGFPQFISSSYRNYAVDFSGDGSTDLIDQPVDAIGSVANYFSKNGWLPGDPVSSPAHSTVSAELAELANRKRSVLYTARALRELGAPLSDNISDTEKLNVLMLNANEIVDEVAESKIYMVRAGDTACQIAEVYDVPCKSLFEINKLDKDGSIFRGQQLKIPEMAKVADLEIYMVRAGDTACQIAEQQGVSCKSLFAVNRLDEKGSIFRGQELKIPAKTKHSPLQTVAHAEIKSGEWKLGADALNNQKSASDATPDATAIPRYFFTHENFYVITRYNQSVLYAMAVYELSSAIATAKDRLAVTMEASQ